MCPPLGTLKPKAKYVDVLALRHSKTNVPSRLYLDMPALRHTKIAMLTGIWQSRASFKQIAIKHWKCRISLRFEKSCIFCTSQANSPHLEATSNNNIVFELDHFDSTMLLDFTCYSATPGTTNHHVRVAFRLLFLPWVNYEWVIWSLAGCFCKSQASSAYLETTSNNYIPGSACLTSVPKPSVPALMHVKTSYAKAFVAGCACP